MTITNDLAVFAGGANSTTIFANGGNLGIGTTSPSFKLDVYNTSRLGLGGGQGSPNNTNITANATLVLGGNGANYIAFGQYGSANFNYAQWIQSSYVNPSTATYNLVLQPLGGSVAIGNTSPIRPLHIYYPTTSAEMVIEMGAGQANRKKWNFVVDGGNNTTPNSLSVRMLDDSGVGVANTGFSINGSTQVFSTATRAISAASMPAGSVIGFNYSNYSGATSGSGSTLVNVTGYTMTYTPKFANSLIYHIIAINMFFICDGQLVIKRNGTTASVNIGDSYRDVSTTNYMNDGPLFIAQWVDNAHNTTSAITYQLAACATGCGQTYFVGSTGDATPYWIVMEIAQ